MAVNSPTDLLIALVLGLAPSSNNAAAVTSWSVSSNSPRSSLPNLPEDLKTKLGYYFNNYEEK